MYIVFAIFALLLSFCGYGKLNGTVNLLDFIISSYIFYVFDVSNYFRN
jgi:hypothetical protein